MEQTWSKKFNGYRIHRLVVGNCLAKGLCLALQALVYFIRPFYFSQSTLGKYLSTTVQRGRSWLVLVLLILAGIIGFWRYNQWREHRFDVVIFAAAHRYRVEPALVKAVVWRESRFNPKIRGRAGEIGLMQVRPAAAQEWANAEKIKTFALEDLFDPGTNTLAGAWYLRKLLRRYPSTDNPLPYALADYNAGRSRVLHWNKDDAATNSAAFIEQIDFPGTRKYVRTVLRRYERYRPILSPME
jgi:soluble lytic murein transglycosylase